MTWRQIILGAVAMIRTRAHHSNTTRCDGLEKARREGILLACQWLAEDLKYLAERPPHEALKQVREWIRAAREAGIELPEGLKDLP